MYILPSIGWAAGNVPCLQANVYDDRADQQGYFTYTYTWVFVAEDRHLSSLEARLANLRNVVAVTIPRVTRSNVTQVRDEHTFRLAPLFSPCLAYPRIQGVTLDQSMSQSLCGYEPRKNVNIWAVKMRIPRILVPQLKICDAKCATQLLDNWLLASKPPHPGQIGVSLPDPGQSRVSPPHAPDRAGYPPPHPGQREGVSPHTPGRVVYHLMCGVDCLSNTSRRVRYHIRYQQLM